MRAYWILYTFALLLLCDYGMFSSPSPSPPESLNIQTSNTSDSNITQSTAETTGEITADTNYTDSQEASTVSYTNTSQETTDNDEGSPGEEEGKTPTPIPSITRPKTTTEKTSTKPAAATNTGGRTAGVIILIFILILIVCLLGILYFLRKKTRSYSFDLTGVGPANDYVTPLRSDQQGISYEQTNKDLPVSLDFVQDEKSEEKSSPVANGCAGEKSEQTPVDDNEEQNVPEENSFSSTSSFTPPLKKVEFNLDLDLIGGESDLNDSTAAEATDAPQNENNNNVTNAGRGTAEEIFTEISLDEPKDNV